ncbi:MAG: dihydropyrimidinase [Candidatus Thermoplasmatota archaeon]
MDLVIKDGTIVTESETFKADLGIENGKIVAIAKELKGDKKINANGKYVMPGGIDVHVHFQLPFCGTVSKDTFESGTKAAAVGGVTTILDFAIQKKGKKIMDAVKERRNEADKNVCIDYSLHSAITDWNERTKEEIKEVIDYGITSFKMFMIYKVEGWMADDAALFSGLEETKKYGGLIEVHAESANLLEKLVEKYHNKEDMEKYGAYCHVLSRPNYVEEEAIQRAIKLAEITGGKLYIVHMSTGGGAEIVKNARLRNIDVHAETCPQYLLLDDSVFKKKDGHLYATCPQIKKKEDSNRLWLGLMNNDIEVVATDTCTFSTEQKNMWNGDFTKIPFGLPGVETLLPLLYSEGVGKGRITINRFVSLISTNPAKLFGLYPEKGSLQIGTDADIVIFDPKKELKISHDSLETNCDWSPYEGMKLKGSPSIVICRGEMIAEDKTFIGKKGFGRFIRRRRF